jgi:hypothetical protein
MKRNKLVSAALALVVGLMASCNNVTPPTNPTGFAATVNSSTQITLNWQAVTGATSYSLERKTGTGAFASIPGSITATTYQDTGLTAATEYTYRLKASNSGGSSSGVETSATTLPNAPANPTGFSATVNSSSQITLNWQAASGATKYALERKIGTGNFSLLSDNITATNYIDAGLSASTLYTYRLKAVNAGGSSSGVEASGTTSGNPAQGTNVQIVNWPAGKTGTLKFTNSTPSGSDDLGTADVDSTGKFSYSLAEPTKLALIPLPTGCTVTPAETQTGFASITLSTTSATIQILKIQNTQSQSVGDVQSYLTYFDRNAAISGTCFSGRTTDTWKVNAKKGWNFLLYTYTATQSGAATASEATVVDVLPADVKWYVSNTNF